MLRRRSLITSLSLAWLMPSIGVFAQGSPPQAITQPPASDAQTIAQSPPARELLPHILFDRIPEARQTPAPDWIKPGTRLVFFSTNAVTQTNPGSMGMKRDPNGNIIDDKGNRWTETEPTGLSGGGVGYTVIDIVASEPGVLVMQNHTYFLPQGKGGPAVLTGATGTLSHPSGCDFFLHPRLLAQVPSMESQNVVIIRQAYDFNSRTYRAMRVSIRNRGISSSVFDLTSGVLLFSRASASQNSGQVVDRNGNIVDAGATASGTHSFVASRPLNLPWTNSTMPAWVKQTRKLKYSGQMISRSPAGAGLPDLSTALQAEVALTQLGGNWSLHSMTSMLDTNVGVPNVPSTTELACGPASIDGVWKDPAFLQRLQTGQSLDQDQAVGTQSMVEFAGRGNDGRNIVAITTVTSQQKSTNVYDAGDGRLIQMIQTQSNPGTNLTTITQLNLVGVE